MLPLNEVARVDCLYGIARALEFLHSQGFVHGGCAALRCALECGLCCHVLAPLPFETCAAGSYVVWLSPLHLAET